MALPPRYIGHHYSHDAAFDPRKGATLEVFLDLHCPFSKKAHFKLKEVVAHYGKDKLDVVFINWIQPWHPQATWLHSALLAASLFDDKSLFWKLADLLYEKQDEFRDEKVEKVSKVEFYDLMTTYAKSVGIDEEQFRKNLASNEVVQLIKWEQKYGRQNGIHASPTFLVNGLVVGQASSGWTLEQWRELLDPLLA
ncbi:uncharacterized protein ACA1_146580 [Acanthamoeba castellanii str. Neff]|uniref:Thioredoxin-like fold domain-containing protein n=1 Tax=Acanthamoeba castellanii (strain ATCC 30010 / Neff) TaxID=1257118 RepID=L8GTM4_ACACF|nr:uncharacterized protein ACA1_146580 [Acanthamoeba castellanii str. Neff]ELR16524.1 hypothetical protein ACA1_146580 [Acanthamoeba castellanii str. Neff]